MVHKQTKVFGASETNTKQEDYDNDSDSNRIRYSVDAIIAVTISYQEAQDNPKIPKMN